MAKKDKEEKYGRKGYTKSVRRKPGKKQRQVLTKAGRKRLRKLRRMDKQNVGSIPTETRRRREATARRGFIPKHQKEKLARGESGVFGEGQKRKSRSFLGKKTTKTKGRSFRVAPMEKKTRKDLPEKETGGQKRDIVRTITKGKDTTKVYDGEAGKYTPSKESKEKFSTLAEKGPGATEASRISKKRPDEQESRLKRRPDEPGGRKSRRVRKLRKLEKGLDTGMDETDRQAKSPDYLAKSKSKSKIGKRKEKFKSKNVHKFIDKETAERELQKRIADDRGEGWERVGRRLVKKTKDVKKKHKTSYKNRNPRR